MKDELSQSLLRGQTILKTSVKLLPSCPGIYKMMSFENEVLYVGKAKRLKNRVASYAQVQNLPIRLKRMVSELSHVEVVETHTETEALLLESNLIKNHRPRYNVLLKDDKSFPYIALTQDHPYPRLHKHRGPQEEKTIYFGPFASSGAVEESLITLYKIFQIRSCTDGYFASRQRPCLQYHIKRCTAPCVGKVSESDYLDQIKQLISFFQGKTDIVQKQLAKKMLQASDALAFEEASQYRDRLKLLAYIQSRQRIHIQGLKDADVLGLAQVGGKTCVQVFFFRQSQNFGSESFFLEHSQDASASEALTAFVSQFYESHQAPPLILLSHELMDRPLLTKALKAHFETPKLGPKRELIHHALQNAEAAIRRKLLENNHFEEGFSLIQKTFQLPDIPQRIEVYDNSHLQGSQPYGAMIVVSPQGFLRQAYRKFIIKSPPPPRGGDDYAMMREVMKRRLSRIGEMGWEAPSLILIDGGQGQLNVVRGVIDELSIEGIQLIAIAKGPDRHAGRERFFLPETPPFTLPPQTPVMHFLQRIRDEAHRYAIGAHRSGRKKKLLKSVLDDIPGIGAHRKKLLLMHFGSPKAVSQAGISDLEAVSGINKGIAQKIYAYFHES